MLFQTQSLEMQQIYTFMERNEKQKPFSEVNRTNLIFFSKLHYYPLHFEFDKDFNSVLLQFKLLSF